ncbi:MULTISPECIES: DUF3307 domain-containing protein [Alphaproteobacteria]|nr:MULTISPECIES: DUF3307 domain-containing protein [Alphaproteobacteria]
MPEMISTPWIVWGIALFLLKQLIADFLLQTRWMAIGKQRRHRWLFPLSVHAGLHGALTGLIFSILAPALAWIGLVDFIVHFAIDRAKAAIQTRLGLDVSQTGFWWLFGMDQTLHHLTHLGLAALLAVSRTL